MSIILFLIILLVLVMVHEFGHFIVAKLCKMRVDEFGVGFPPTIWKRKWRGTEYKINSLPLGGYVKIFGENGSDEDEAAKLDPQSFGNRPWWQQILVLLAGVAMNWVLAFVIFLSLALFTVQIASVDNADYNNRLSDVRTEVLDVQIGSPADLAGIKSGDRIVSVTSSAGASLVAASATTNMLKEFISSHPDNITISFTRGGVATSTTLSGVEGIVNNKKAIGIVFDHVGDVKIGVSESFKLAAAKTVDTTKMVYDGTIELFANLIKGNTDMLHQVSGPIGIAKVVGDASHNGATRLLLVTALLSVNLAVFNLLPFPALDGGRIIVVLIEAITRRKVPAVAQAWINGIGFLILIAIMIAVSVSDVMKFIK